MIVRFNWNGQPIVVEVTFRELCFIGAYGGVGIVFYHLWEDPALRG